jgi:hypothetical protein
MAEKPPDKHEEKHEEKREERTVTLTETQIRDLVARQVKEQLATMGQQAEKARAQEAERKAEERKKQMELYAQQDPFAEIDGITWVFNRSRRMIEVVWNMRSTEIPPLTVMPLSNAVARQSLAAGAYRNIGTIKGVSAIVLKGDENWMKPLSQEEQEYMDGTDPIKYSRIPLAETLVTRSGQALGPPELVEFESEGAPAHPPPVDRGISFVGVGTKP